MLPAIVSTLLNISIDFSYWYHKSNIKVMVIKTPFLVFLIGIMLFPAYVYSKTLGEYGTTYPIIEKDALEEIEERAKAIDWNKHLDKKKWEDKIKNYKPDNLTSLPRAKQDKIFNVDMTYTLDMDIPDGKGGILYPKGYTFNPLVFINYPNTLVVINGDDKKQVEWFNKSQYSDDIKTMLLLTEGNYFKLREQLKRPVYSANKQITDRLKLQSVPSIVSQKGLFMEIKEIKIDD
jgi:conjugal transfer pilus assembly protein TraW